MLINACKNLFEVTDKQRDKTIDIVVKTNQEQLEIIINGQGKGIANSENLFMPFYRTIPQGSGIGLTLYRQIMFNHGGSINVVNRLNTEGYEAIIILKQS